MKLLTGLVFGLVSAARDGKPDRSVPPRHPSNRLNRLANKLAVDILDHPQLSWKQGRKDRVLANLQGFADKMQNRFDSDNCGYYNSEVKHGGPDPEPNTRESGKPRKDLSRRRRDLSSRDRRDGEDWRQNEWVKTDTTFGWLYEACFADDYSKLENPQWDFVLESSDDLCDESLDSEEAGVCEYFDTHTCQFKNTAGDVLVRGKRGGRKLSENPQKAWKQVTTGLKKWAQRYLNNCHGMRKNKIPATRAKSMYNRWVEKFPVSWV